MIQFLMVLSYIFHNLSLLEYNLQIEGDFEDTEEGEYCLDAGESADNGREIPYGY